jgi:hypothetical protein
MNEFGHLMFRITSDRTRSLVVCIALAVYIAGYLEPAVAQAPPIEQNPTTSTVEENPTTPSAEQNFIAPPDEQNPAIAIAPILGQSFSPTQATPVPEAPTAPPLYAPEVDPLPTGRGALSFGPWLLTPTLGLYTLYDTNIYSSTTNALAAPGFDIHPSLLADFDNGFCKTSIYGNIDSKIYPTLDSQNNTFDRQAGVIQSYAPLRDLIFTAQGDYTHSTNAFVITNSLPNPLISPASPALPGAAGVFGNQQTEVDPNDTYTGTATVYKELNRGFVQLSGSFARTEYEGSPSSNPGQFLPDFNRESYYGSGGVWLSPLFYAYTDGVQAFTDPAGGPNSSAYRARGGIGTAPMGPFRGSVYAGWQGADVVDAGTAGGDIYGGIVSYIPSAVWNVNLSIDRLTNISNITSTVPQAQSLGGLQFVAAGIPLSASAQITSITLSSNYAFSPQTSVFGVVSDSQIGFIGIPRVDNSWLAAAGIRHRLSSNLLLTFDYQYTSYISPAAFTSFTRNLATVGAIYNF